MITITVNASKTYDVKIGKGLLCRLGSEVRAVSKAERVCFVSDNNVWTRDMGCENEPVMGE